MTHKGVVEEEAAQRAIEGIRSFGYRQKILLKVDNERALKSLREAATTQLAGGGIPIEPLPGESASNGGVENGVKLFKGFLRVHLLALERKIAGHIPTSHPIMAWLVEFVADTLTKYLQGNDGRTGYQRLFGKQVHEEALEFGERVLVKTRKAKDANGLLDARWVPAIWLGRIWGSITQRIAMEDGREVIEARAVHRAPLPERWSRALLEQVVAACGSGKW